MTDYERGVEQASAVYKEVIREYVAENNELRERVRKQAIELEALRSGRSVLEVEDEEIQARNERLRTAARERGLGVDE